jgi:signal transduction histidine kinase
MSNVTILPAAFELSPSAARAHAMKNCLGVILAICHLTERELGEKNRARWSHLDAAARRLRDLLLDDPALDERHREAKPDTTSTRCGVGQLVAAVVERLDARAEASGVRLIVNCGGGELDADADDLAEALFNLVVNAIEATPRGGTVSLATCPNPDGTQQWTLRDTGIGFDEEDLMLLGTAPRSGKKGGWGIGVALASATIARHGGTLRISSSKGGGASMSISLTGRGRPCLA